MFKEARRTSSNDIPRTVDTMKKIEFLQLCGTTGMMSWSSDEALRRSGGHSWREWDYVKGTLVIPARNVSGLPSNAGWKLRCKQSVRILEFILASILLTHTHTHSLYRQQIVNLWTEDWSLSQQTLYRDTPVQPWDRNSVKDWCFHFHFHWCFQSRGQGTPTLHTTHYTLNTELASN